MCQVPNCENMEIATGRFVKTSESFAKVGDCARFGNTLVRGFLESAAAFLLWKMAALCQILILQAWRWNEWGCW